MTNEQRYKAPEERAEAFRKFCNSKQCNECECSKDGKKFVALCEFRWLALEAEEELLSCPFCGGEAELVHPLSMGYAYDRYFVTCKECRATSMRYSTEADAIAAWNRRVKR